MNNQLRRPGGNGNGGSNAHGKPPMISAPIVGGKETVDVGEPVNVDAPAQDLPTVLTPSQQIATDEHNEEFINPRDKRITLIGDIAKTSHVIGMWDTALSVCGADIFSPPTVDQTGDGTEIELGDFAVNVKIRKSDFIMVVANDDGAIPPYMFPWIHFAFAKGKKVYLDQPVVATNKIATFKLNGFFKQLTAYPLSRKGFEEYTKDYVYE